MKQFLRFSTLALISGTLLAGSYAGAQQSNPTRNQQNQYTGVSHPPPNSTIVADEPISPPPSQTKPSPVVPKQPERPVQTPPSPNQSAADTAYTAPARTADFRYSSPAASSDTSALANNNPNRWNNTDFGIVTKLPDQRAIQQVKARDAQMNQSANPAFGVVSVIPFAPHALNAGTNITVRLSKPLSTSNTPQGTPFRATVVSNVYRGSQLIIPAGSKLRGIVTGVHPGRHLISRATLRLTPQSVLLPDGTAYRLDAEAIYTSAQHAKTTEEGAFQPTMHLAKDTAEYGAGTGLGALVGAKFGPGGVLIGSLVGAGAVSAHMLVQPPSALNLPRDTEIVFSLTRPMELTPLRD